jgi:hypothetical protein
VGIRQVMNDKPWIGLTMAGLVLAIGLALIWGHLSGHGPSEPGDKAFFTTDDGKTWFAADVTNIPPFDREGKQACRAIVLRCGNGEPFVHHLESYPPQVRKQLEDSVAAAGDQSQKIITVVRGERMLLDDVLVKKPGDPGWVRLTPKDAEAYRKISIPACPDGQDMVTVDP